ncbi:acyl carrier protein [Paenibacillus lycopersici]|uniref:Acyl carrier protein n=1 Tax=Paenibacillus lycopersici TaxID=2704462 RepID=A0A6C0G535_9BACL|nr:acyl carrier protein [Paenibacillus lycopersici]QHT63423.1 acyl carrier protein [Paenibacillus lycopersici]
MNRVEQIRTIVSAVMEVPVEQVKLESVKNDFEKWDSLGQLNLILEIESVFGISIPIDHIANIDSVQAIVDIAQELAN